MFRFFGALRQDQCRFVPEIMHEKEDASWEEAKSVVSAL